MLGTSRTTVHLKQSTYHVCSPGRLRRLTPYGAGKAAIDEVPQGGFDRGVGASGTPKRSQGAYSPP